MTEYERLSIYDAPGVALAQIMEGEASMRSLANTVLRPGGLTPQQRTDLADRLTGGSTNVMTQALAGIATNPFVWLMAATSATPILGKGARAANEMFDMNSKMRDIGLSKNPVVAFLLSPFQRAAGTSAMSTAGEIHQNLSRNLGYADEGGTRSRAAEAFADKISRAIGDVTGHKGLQDGSASIELLREIPDGIPKGVDVEAVGLTKYLEQLMTARAAMLRKGRWIPVGHRTAMNKAGEIIDETTVAGTELSFLQRNKAIDNRIKELYDTKPPGFMDDIEQLKDQKFEMQDIAVDVKRLDEEMLAEADVVIDAWNNLETQLNLPRGTLDKYYKAKQYEKKLNLVYQIGDESDLASRIDKINEGADDAWDGFVFKVDEGKAKRYANHVLNEAEKPKWVTVDTEELQGDELLRRVISDPARAAKGELTSADMENIKAVFTGGVDFHNMDWHARTNVMAQVDHSGLRPEATGSNAPSSLRERLAPWTDAEETWDWQDMEKFQDNIRKYYGDVDVFTKEGQRKLDRWYQKATRKNKAISEPISTGIRMNFLQSHDRHLKHGAQVRAFYTDKASIHALIDDMRLLDERGVRAGGATHLSFTDGTTLDANRAVLTSLSEDDLTALQKGLSEYQDLAPDVPLGRWLKEKKILSVEQADELANAMESYSPGLLLEKSKRNLMSAGHQGAVDLIDNTITPLAFDEIPLQAKLERAGHIVAAEQAREISEGRGFLGKVLQVARDRFKSEEAGKIMQRMGELGDVDAAPSWLGRGKAGVASGFLYKTHLGLNPASIILNLYQPLTLLGSISDDPTQLARGYVRALRFGKEYATLRSSRHGFKRITDVERTSLIDDALAAAHKDLDPDLIPTARELGISENMMTTMDYMLQSRRKTGWLDFTLKPFEKGEWINRMVTADVARQMHIKQGKPFKGSFNTNYRQTINNAVEGLQFGSTGFNTPGGFQQGSALGNPLARQFLSFPTRTATMALYTVPGMYGTNYATGLARATIMGLGVSAMVYEAQKAVGINMDRGLYVESLAAAVDPEQGQIPTPPVVNIPMDFLMGVTKGDWALVGRTAMRTLVPGGVAVSRIPRVADRMPGPLGALLQKEYVDWNDPIQEGDQTLYPTMTRDGRLIEYRTKAELVGRALGVDLGTYQEQGGLDQYLLAQGDNIKEARRAYLDALARNDSSKARQIQSRFQKDFGIPLTATNAQLKGFMRSRSQGRTERILDRTPLELRPMLAQQVKSAGYARNVDVTAGDTASRRERPERDLEIEELRRRLDAVGGGGPESGAFEGFSGF